MSIIPRKKTDKEWKQEVLSLVGTEYVFLEPYQGNKVLIEVKHNIPSCGHIYKVKPNNFSTNHSRCPKCFGTPKQTNEDFKNMLFLKYNDTYSLVGDYITTHDKVSLLCNRCGTTFVAIAGHVKRGHFSCPVCDPKSHQQTTETFKKSLIAHGVDDIILLDELKNADTKIKFKCLVCQTVFESKPYRISLQSHGCPYCAQHQRASSGEINTEKCLEAMGFSFEGQKRFDDLRDIYKLSYDFYIDSIYTLIEFQGIQHYKPTRGVRNFIIQQYHDKLKANYAKQHGYYLISIPYTCDTEQKVYNFIKANLLS